MSTAHEQHEKTSDWFNAVADWAATFTTKNTTAGNLYWAFVFWSDTAVTVSSITDTESNTWAAIANTLVVGSGFSSQMWVAKNVVGGTKPTVTAHFSATTSNKDLAIHEASGCDTTSPLDGSTGKTTVGSGADGISTDAFSTTQNGCLLVGAMASPGQQATTASAGTGYTLRVSDNGHSEVLATETQVQTSASASTVAAFGVSGFTTANVCAAAFKPQAAGVTAAQQAGIWSEALSGGVIGRVDA